MATWRGVATWGLMFLVIAGGGRTVVGAQDATSPPDIRPYAPGADLGSLRGRVVADGSSTVWLVTNDIAESFGALAEDVAIDLEISGTSGGFRRFCAGASDVQNASRAIAEDERGACATAGVAYHAFEIGFDGITVVVARNNDFVDCLTVDQLRLLWRPDDPATSWRDLDPTWPDREIDLYGPSEDSGTFDYFTAQVVGEEGASRLDYTDSEIDDLLVRGVGSSADGLGYFGYAYYEQSPEELRAVAVDAGAGCVAPSPRTIADGTYRPLSRPLYVYVNRASLARPEVAEFMRFYLASAREVVEIVGYVPTGDATYAANQGEFDAAIAGTAPPDGPAPAGTPVP